MIFGLKPIIKGQRGTHPGGVGSEGIATIVSDPKFPACEFFTLAIFIQSACVTQLASP